MLPRKRSYWLVFALPALVAFFSILLKLAVGPLWQYPDPTYVHLLNSVNLVKGIPTAYYDSPGVPVQILGQWIIWALNIGHSTSETIKSVLLNPELYLSAMNAALSVLVFITSALLGAYVFSKTNDILAVFLSQLPDLFILILRSNINDLRLIYCNISPEHLLVSITNLYNLCLLKLFFARSQKEQDITVLILALISGLGTACKLTFLPLFIVPFVLARWPLKFGFILAAAAAFVAGTYPIIPLYPKLWQWINDITTHTGIYGAGGRGIIDIHAYFDTWKYILKQFWFFVLFPLSALAISSFQFLVRKTSRSSLFIWLISLTAVFQLVLVAKHFDDHYLTIFITSSASLFVLFYLAHLSKNTLLKAAAALFMAFSIIYTSVVFTKYFFRTRDMTSNIVGFSRMIHAKYPNFIYLGSYLHMPISNPEYALFMGNDSSGGGEKEELTRLYPRSYSFFADSRDIAGSCTYGIYNFKQAVWADDLLAKYPDIMFINSGYGFSDTPYIVKPLEEGKYSIAYLLVGSTEKEANAFFNASLAALSQGKLQQGFALALRARQLNYQPAGKLQYLLYMVYAHLKPSA